MNEILAGSSGTLGLALSGGGSRAAAFHRGTLRALTEIGLLKEVAVVSTVSGGSLFGAAWLAARSNGSSDAQFLSMLGQELERGFVLRSVRPRLLKTLLPGGSYTRTNVIAETFDRIFFHGKTLSQLPERPALCLNTTVLNNGEVGKFSRKGFSAFGLNVPGSHPSYLVPLPDFPIALAVGASAAFPVGLPPLLLSRKRLPENLQFGGSLAGSRSLALTDGGVLENLGIQTLLKSNRFRTWNLVVSDAGTKSKLWRCESWLNTPKSLGVWLLSGRILDQLMLVMNDKENRWARQQVIEEVNSSWLAESVRSGGASAPLAQELCAQPALPRRRVLFVRVNQNWNSFLGSIPRYRLLELAVAHGMREQEVPKVGNSPAVQNFLVAAGLDLRQALDEYAKLGGDEGASRMNKVATNFTALPRQTVEQLEAHAAWQIHLAREVYWLQRQEIAAP